MKYILFSYSARRGRRKQFLVLTQRFCSENAVISPGDLVAIFNDLTLVSVLNSSDVFHITLQMH